MATISAATTLRLEGLADRPIDELRQQAIDSTCARTGNGDAIRNILDRIGDKWSLLVIVVLGTTAQRFGELSRSIPGISQRMLTLTLRNLERDGLVSRTVFAEVPPRVEYRVTPLGHTLVGPVMALAAWATENEAEILDNRDRFDSRND
jgi:DNA-binding HxlR family transcriptional regulator